MPSKLTENRLLRSIGLPILKVLGRDVLIRHHWLDRKIRLNLFVHKGYWFHGRRREAKEMKAFAALISPGDTVVEVGGHIGYISLWFAECVQPGSGGRVTVFEPGLNNLPYIRENIAGVEQIALIEKGCGPAEGRLEFFEDSLTGQNNSFVDSFEGLRANMDAAPNVDVRMNKRMVDVVRLDSQLGKTAPDFVKVDVEGFELSVLRGASGWFDLPQKPPIIMVEVQADYAEICGWLTERGYALFDGDGQEISTIPNSTVNLFALNREHHSSELLRWQLSKE